MSDQVKHQESCDAIWQGAHARALGRPKDACPYPAGSVERREWLEGYDGTPIGDRQDPLLEKRS